MIFFLKWAASVIGILLPGWIIHRFIQRKEPCRENLWIALAAALPLGMAALSLEMFIYSWTGVAFNSVILMVPWLILLFFQPCRPFFAGFRKSQPDLFEKNKLSSPAIFFLFVLVFQSGYVVLHALAFPVSGWDAWAYWFFQAKVFFLEQGVSFHFLQGLSGHYDTLHPFMLPLCLSWIYLMLGQVSDLSAKIIFPLQYLSLLGLFYFFLKRLGSPQAMIFTALASLIPVLVIHSGGLSPLIRSYGALYHPDFVGYADLTLALFSFGASGYLALGMKSQKAGDYFHAALFAGACAWVKSEGLIFAILALVLIEVECLRNQAMRPQAIRIFLVWILFVVPWYGYKVHWHMKISSYLYRWNFSPIDFMRRGLFLVFAFVKYMFLDWRLFNFLWYGYVLTTLAARNFFWKRPFLQLHLLLLFQITAYVAAYLVTPLEIIYHVLNSIERLLLHVAPLALFLTSLQWDGASQQRLRIKPLP